MEIHRGCPADILIISPSTLLNVTRLGVIGSLKVRDRSDPRQIDQIRIRGADERNDAVFKLWKTVDCITAVRQEDIAAGSCKEVPGHVDIISLRWDGWGIFLAIQCVDPHIPPPGSFLGKIGD